MRVAGSMQTPSEASDRALARGVLYTALALGFRTPSAETIVRLTERSALEALADAARLAEDEDTALARHVHPLAERAPTLEALSAAHRRLFGHTARGEVSPYETEYGAEALFQQPQELGDLAGFAEAFGLALRRDAHERIDHVSCECELASFFAWKEAYAILHGDEEMREITVRASALFFRDHLARFAPVFARRLVRADADGFYAALGRLLLAVVESDCRRLEVATGPETLGLRPDPAACAAPMGCEAQCGTEPGAS
jgi:TorA maturation chaperone TorD